MPIWFFAFIEIFVNERILYLEFDLRQSSLRLWGGLWGKGNNETGVIMS